ncbi:hypothetical protein GCM10017559_24270 [Streptosporangium longisporum]|uniref:Uncharacterized protein n=1 Tax=Streptosporangium longisporum TaxID=46187 RepID=A0ABP6KFU9_9ACTN
MTGPPADHADDPVPMVSRVSRRAPERAARRDPDAEGQPPIFPTPAPAVTLAFTEFGFSSV